MKKSRGVFLMTIFIPTPLRPFAGGQSFVEVDAPTVAEALSALTRAHPDLRNHLFTAEGRLRAFVNVYLNDEDVRYLPARDATPVAAADTLTIIPSIAGGSRLPSRVCRMVLRRFEVPRGSR
jgi:molybdopterin converting factor small subunit